MKLVSALAVAFLFSAAPALAQIAPSTTKPKPPAQTAPSTPAKSASAPAGTPAPPVADKIDPAKEAAIRHLMDITQTSKLGDNITTYFQTRVKSVISEAMGDRTTKFMDTFSAKLAAAAPPSAVVDAMVPIYAKAFSMEDIQGLIQFYDSPVGQRVVKVMPKVEEDSQNAALQIGNAATLAALQSMTDEYPELKQMLQAPSPGAGDGGTPGQPSGQSPAQGPGQAPTPNPGSTPQK